MGYDQLVFLHHQQQLQQQEEERRPQSRSRYGGERGGAAAVMGEIVEVQGGHIVRSTGRKDRHSKVCTAKGLRDRRVRLAAQTAIQFYDVQDRLGYDRPSKAVDWLMKNAKAAIDELKELPPWSPSATLAAAAASRTAPVPSDQSSYPELSIGDSSRKPVTALDEQVVSPSFTFDRGGGNDNASFLPPSLDTDAIADTIKSFFPVAAATTAPPPSSTPNSIGFIGTARQAQDLRLSLQSFQDPIFHNPEPSHQQHHHSQLSFDATSAAGWAGQTQRLVPWNVTEPNDVGDGYMVSFPPPQQAPPPPPLHSVLGESLLLSQRGPLQSSNDLLTVRAWADPVDAAEDHRMQFALHPSMSSIGFASGAPFSGFRVPAHLQGDDEHEGIAGKPPSTSRH